MLTKVIKYEGSDYTHLNEMSGCTSYYADPKDALDNHKFVSKVISWTTNKVDLLGKPYEVISK